MDVLKAVETYITKMVSEPSVMKVLLLDTHTVCAQHVTMFNAYHNPADAYCLVCVHPVDAPVTPGLSHRPDRQQEARSNGAHEMRLFPSAERRQS